MTLNLSMTLSEYALEKLFEPLKVCDRISVKTEIGNSSQLCCFLTILSYCCDISKENDLWRERNSLLERKSYILCHASLNDVSGPLNDIRRTIRYTSSAREVFKVCLKNLISSKGDKLEEIDFKRKGMSEMSNFSISKSQSFWSDNSWQLNRTAPEMHLLLSFEPIYYYNQDILEFLTEALVRSFCSKIMFFRGRGTIEQLSGAKVVEVKRAFPN